MARVVELEWGIEVVVGGDSRLELWVGSDAGVELETSEPGVETSSRSAMVRATLIILK